MRKQSVSIIGATGAVGQELIACLEKRHFPLSRLRLFGSSRSRGKVHQFGPEKIEVEEYSGGALPGEDFVFLCAGSAVSKPHAAALAGAGSTVIDLSSAFRMDPEVPLVIPEINPEALANHRGLIANPNCTTIILLMALAPLRNLGKILKVIVSTYQAASGKGAKGLEELEMGLKAGISGETPPAKEFPRPLAMNVVPQADRFLEDGGTFEEQKVFLETLKILNDTSIIVDATCVRVPVRRCHSESVLVDFQTMVTPEEARKAWEGFPGLQVFDNPDRGEYPHPLMVEGKEDVFVGRCRGSQVFPYGIQFWVVGDQLLKGAALNAIQIAESLVQTKAPE